MASAPASVPSPTLDEVRQIAAIANPVVRNLRITECYHRLSLAFRERTGECANWCTFATWASRQAGRTIRGEDFLENLATHSVTGGFFLHPIRSLWRIVLRRGVFYPKTRLGRLVRRIHSPFDAFERASDAVARGNLKVFAEIGAEFARYMSSCPAGSASDSAEFRSFLDGLRAGDPPEGQDLLRRAFLHYQQQAEAADASGRAQLTLLANLEIGLHEQTRLQPEIREALEAAPATAEDLKLRGPFGFLAAPFIRSYSRYVRDVTCRVVTEALMVLALPQETVLKLSGHIDRPVPDLLRNTTDAELLVLLGRFEPQGPAEHSCGADDWSDLNQRMHYIVHLFREFHTEANLFEPPFSGGQRSEIKVGRIPDGRL